MSTSRGGMGIHGGHKLAHSLDLSCPIALPARPRGEVLGWPVTSKPAPDAELEPACAPDEVYNLYLATLLLPEDLLPLTHTTSDILSYLRLQLSTSASSSIPFPSAPLESIQKCLLPLSDIERRYRRILLPFVNALADGSSSADIKAGRIEDASKEVEKAMGKEAVDAVRAAVGLRMGCRAVVEGDGVLVGRKVVEELEQREILLQISLLLIRLSLFPLSSNTSGPISDGTDSIVAGAGAQPARKKRKRDRRRADGRDDWSTSAIPTAVDPRAHPSEALELLFDRVVVWMMVAELSTGAAENGPSTGVQTGEATAKRTGVVGAVHRFWKHVLHPHFLHLLPAQCSAFHQKVFNKPFQPTSTKKPRKPQLTRAKPSSDDIPVAPTRQLARSSSLSRHGDGVSSEPQRPASQSRLPSESLSHQGHSRLPSRRSSPAREASLAPADMHRSASHTSLDARMRSRSRSMSVDPAAHDGLSSSQTSRDRLAEPARRNSGNTSNGSASALTRQPSGKDLFKGRQVGLLRRSASGAMRRTASDKEAETQSQGQTQQKGLFGRKTSGPQSQSLSQSQLQSQPQSQSQAHQGRRPSDPLTAAGSQGKSETLIMATPSKPRHRNQPGYPYGHGHAYGYDGYYAPTPIAEEPAHERPTRVAETPQAPRIAHSLFGAQKRKIEPTSVADVDVLGDDSDPFGELMVPTDDEDDEEPGDELGWARSGGVPETPAR